MTFPAAHPPSWSLRHRGGWGLDGICKLTFLIEQLQYSTMPEFQCTTNVLLAFVRFLCLESLF